VATNLDRQRRAAWARRIAADQRAEAARAATILKDITRQIRSIQAAGGTTLSSVAALQGAGVVTAVLPNGRRTRMRIIPTVAAISDLNRLRSVLIGNERRHAIAIEKNSRAIASLAAAQVDAVRRLTAQQAKSDKELRKRLVEADDRLDRRIARKISR
jgi:hypothetical protein